MKNVAELGYSRQNRTLELTVPHGTKIAGLSKIIESLSSSGLIARLPRGCTGCHSGDNFNIRERLEEVIQVDLETYKILED